jgi:cobaltochelatase CobN/magnesium chelatase subunit H
MLGNVPNTYLYHVVNVSEGTIAKRRSYAQLISYASPTFAPAGLYEHLNHLEDLMAEYDDKLRGVDYSKGARWEALGMLSEIAANRHP